MTLDEAIQHCEEIAEEQEKLYRLCPASESDMFHCDGTGDCKTLKNGKNKGCRKCADEHQQLAEWLKELKAYREQSGDAVSRDAVLDALDKVKYSNEFCVEHHIDWSVNLSMAHIVVNQMPPVTPQQKTGWWKFTVYDANRIGHYECSECHWNVLMNVSDYCPHCGAKMECENAI